MSERIVVAYGNHREIGARGRLLWQMPHDMRRFRELTTGGSIIMGRTTWESIGMPLPNRESIVVTSRDEVHPEVKTARSLDEALGKASCRLVSIIGGAELYAAALAHPDIREAYATWVHGNFPTADTFFPGFSPDEWCVVDVEQYARDDRHAYDYDFFHLIKEK